MATTSFTHNCQPLPTKVGSLSFFVSNTLKKEYSKIRNRYKLT